MLLNSNNNNNFSAFYKEEEINLNNNNIREFDYDYMIYLRDRALARYNLLDNLLSNKNLFNDKKLIKNLKEEEKIIENNKYFVEFVNQANQLIKLLTKISQKGFLYYFRDKEIKKDENNKDIVKYFKQIENIKDVLLLKIRIKIQLINEKNTKFYKTKFILNGEEKKNYSEIYEKLGSIYQNIFTI